MKLYVDLETLQLIEGPGFRNPVGTLRFKRGDAARLEVVFLENATTPVEIGDPAALELHFGIKPRNRYDVGYLVHSSDWTLPASGGADPTYLCAPSFNTEELDSAMQVGSSTGFELSEILLMGEITWREGTEEPTSTRTFLVLVENDVNRGTEGVPVSAEPPYPAPAAIELVANKGAADGYAGLDGGGKVPVAQLPTIPAGVSHQLFNQTIANGTSVALDLGALAGAQDLVHLRFHVRLPGYATDGPAFYLLDAALLGVLDDEVLCPIAGVDGAPAPYWLYDIWIEGAFSGSRPTKMSIRGQQCLLVADGYSVYGGSVGWIGSGIGTVDEVGQINFAVMSGVEGSYGSPDAAYNTQARYLRIRNSADASLSSLQVEGVITRYPTQA